MRQGLPAAAGGGVVLRKIGTAIRGLFVGKGGVNDVMTAIFWLKCIFGYDIMYSVYVHVL